MRAPIVITAVSQLATFPVRRDTIIASQPAVIMTAYAVPAPAGPACRLIRTLTINASAFVCKGLFAAMLTRAAQHIALA